MKYLSKIIASLLPSEKLKDIKDICEDHEFKCRSEGELLIMTAKNITLEDARTNTEAFITHLKDTSLLIIHRQIISHIIIDKFYPDNMENLWL